MLYKTIKKTIAMEQRYEVNLQNDLFVVYDKKENTIISKGYKYSRYAFNLQSKLELGH